MKTIEDATGLDLDEVAKRYGMKRIGYQHPWWRRFLCFIGLHKKESTTIKLHCSVKNKETGKWESRDEGIYYDVCKYCDDGHPMKTGEW